MTWWLRMSQAELEEMWAAENEEAERRAWQQWWIEQGDAYCLKLRCELAEAYAAYCESNAKPLSPFSRPHDDANK